MSLNVKTPDDIIICSVNTPYSVFTVGILTLVSKLNLIADIKYDLGLGLGGFFQFFVSEVNSATL